ncbi:MAG: hypothetical protein KME38_01695 [Spirirestis rafaelensis WJT71-NPBG6]|jgi:hypothetical protein|nr:hypothetical protein [Spirirestis rafaelensis WJT71-NPBG6]
MNGNTNKIEAAPFLVSSSQQQDYTKIVAPDFICRTNSSTLLKSAVSRFNQPTQPNQAIYIETFDSQGERIFLVFRTTWASKKYIDEQEDEILKDQGNRPIAFIEGLVLQKAITDNVVSSQNLDEAHKQVVEHYKDFWQSSQLVKKSKDFDFFKKEIDSSKNIILLKQSSLLIEKPNIVTLTPADIHQRSPVLLITILVIITIVVFGLWKSQLLFNQQPTLSPIPTQTIPSQFPTSSPQKPPDSSLQTPINFPLKRKI